ncbi:MAG TPA: DeoR/GlpR family DNA-binding transcription regulator [Spirochaetia bacterium]|nr:DeoR/GlpR family DNA-binding transcription regulator [Spirochaetia bacterium]
MRPETRQSEIVTLLRAMQKELRVDELASMLRVSALTIRRDLEQLAAGGRVIRTHGGCIAAGRAALETEYHSKVAQNFELKQAVGRAAAEEVRPGSVVLVNDGSTTFHVAAHLEERAPLTVFTNSIAMITDLGRIPGIELYILGGRYNRELYSLQGSLTEHILEGQQFDVCFIGADSVTPEGQCMVVTPEEASLTRAMLRRARRRVLLADHTKCAEGGYHAYGTLKDFNLWITTAGVPAELLQAYRTMVQIKEA